jgi:sulfur dioxygenase
LTLAINTHVHADHITGTHKLRDHFKLLKTGLGSKNTDAKSDLKFDDGEIIKIGDVDIEVRHTPGHTAGCVIYVVHQAGLVFTGDTLFIRGCGRTG